MYVPLNALLTRLDTMQFLNQDTGSYNVTFRFSKDSLERFDVDTTKAHDIRGDLLASRPVLLVFGNTEHVIFPSQLEEVVFTYFPPEEESTDD